MPVVLANPQGGRVTAGSASIHQTSRSRLDVNQRSDRAVIDWRTFNIGKNEHTNFRQPSTSAIALNRVQGGDLSTIAGRLSANGQVYLVNQNGILFGNNARVDVAGLVATTADIGNEDFMNGIHRFSRSSENPAAQVVNKGQIHIQEGGAVVLAAPRVSNEGRIDARLGKVALAGVETFTLDLNGDGLLQYDLGSEVSEKPSAMTTVSDALVSNAGTIVADGGLVSMSARAADQVVDRVINMTGVVQARAVEVKGGTIILSGGDQGIVDVSGDLDASGRAPGQTGGTVKVLGEKVGLFDGTRIDATGGQGGGEVLVGGNFQGRGPEPNAKRAFVAEDASIEADATSDGDGGKVIVWSDEATRFRGGISAQGGNDGGDGGFIEVSGKHNLEFVGDASVEATYGNLGTILLDPIDIIIDDFVEGGADDPELDDNQIFFEDGVSESFQVDDEALEGLNGNILLQAQNDININTALELSQTNGTSVVFQANSSINVNSNISTQGGGLHFEADLNPETDAEEPSDIGTLNIDDSQIQTNGGAIDLIAQTLNIVGESVIDAGTGDINIARIVDSDQGPGSAPAAAELTVGPEAFLEANDFEAFVTSGTLTLGRATLFGPDGIPDTIPLTLTAPALIVNAPIQANATNLALTAAGALNINADITVASLSAVAATIGLQNVTTTGDQSYTGAVTFNSSYNTNGGNFAVTGDSVIVSTTSVSTNEGDILFNGRLNGDNTLDLAAGAGDIVFADDVGTSIPLGAIRIDSARNITIDGRFGGGATRFNYSGVATSAEDSLNLASLLLSPLAVGATLFGTVNGSSGDDAALAVQGPVNDRDFTINGCVVGVPCGVVPLPVPPPTGAVVLAPAAQPVPFREEFRALSTAPSSPKVRALVTVYKRRPPSADPTEPQYSNFGNEELWD